MNIYELFLVTGGRCASLGLYAVNDRAFREAGKHFADGAASSDEALDWAFEATSKLAVEGVTTTAPHWVGLATGFTYHIIERPVIW